MIPDNNNNAEKKWQWLCSWVCKLNFSRIHRVLKMMDCYIVKQLIFLDSNLRLIFSCYCLFAAEVKFCTNVYALPAKGKT